jgi:hypothetical protein
MGMKKKREKSCDNAQNATRKPQSTVAVRIKYERIKWHLEALSLTWKNLHPLLASLNEKKNFVYIQENIKERKK